MVGVAISLNFSWWLLSLGLFGYIVLGGCPDTWTGFSIEAFSGLWEFVKLSVASGVMLWSLSLSLSLCLSLSKVTSSSLKCLLPKCAHFVEAKNGEIVRVAEEDHFISDTCI